MGLFLQEKKVGKQASKNSNRAGFFEELFFVLVRVVIAIFAWVGKYTITSYVSMITYAWIGKEGAVEKKRMIGRLVAALMIVIPLYLIYTIPSVRNLTLSKKQTVNLRQVTGAIEIVLPGTEYFEITDQRQAFSIEQNPSIEYITFSRDSEDIILVAERGQCLLVPRGKTVDIRSNYWPIYAVGFEETVRYRIKGNHSADLPLDDISSQISISLNPLYTSNSWAVFYNNWGKLQKVRGKNLPFAIEAKSDENAMICF